MRKYGIYLLLVLAGAACQKPGTFTLAEPSWTSKPTITQQDIQTHIDMLPKHDAAFAATPIGRQNLLQVILREKLILADARAKGLHRTEDFHTLAANKRKQLAEIYQAYLTQILEQLWYKQQQEKLNISDEEIAAYYKKYPYEMTVKQIIVEDAEIAEQVLRTLKSSPGRWRDMERQYSVAPETIRAQNFSFMPGEFLPEIEVIAANSAVGSVQGFIKTAFGFHIIMKTGEKRLSQNEAAPRIRAVLENKKIDTILESLQNEYEVKIYDENK